MAKHRGKGDNAAHFNLPHDSDEDEGLTEEERVSFLSIITTTFYNESFPDPTRACLDI